MKLSDYAKQQVVRYKTAWRWFQDGKIKGHRVGAHTVMIDEAIIYSFCSRLHGQRRAIRKIEAPVKQLQAKDEEECNW